MWRFKVHPTIYSRQIQHLVFSEDAERNKIVYIETNKKKLLTVTLIVLYFKKKNKYVKIKNINIKRVENLMVLSILQNLSATISPYKFDLKY